jgi:putative spermidine/putrescine transport system ATP-binding protein
LGDDREIIQRRASSVHETPIVEFASVEKSYDGRTFAVKDVSFRMEQGEFLTFLGPSGSGKTTCLMMLAGFETVTHGRILIGGKEVNNAAPHKRNIGMVFQDYALFPHMSVTENVGYPLRVRRTPKREIVERIKTALDAVRLANFGDRAVTQLSGGERQRVALARALVFNPKIVLMDEPLSALDKELREEMQFEIRRIHNTLGISVVYVTHDQGEALVMSDRIAVLNNGTIQQLSSPKELYESPCNSLVARFIGENNILPAQIKGSDSDGLVVTVGVCEIHCSTKTRLPVGRPVFLSVRPEVIMLGPHATPCANQFSGKIQDVIYRGDHLRIRLDAFGQNDFIAKIPKHLAKSLMMETGHTVALGWNAEDCNTLEN